MGVHYLIPVLLYFVSGFCGLVYEVVWNRMLVLVMGTPPTPPVPFWRLLWLDFRWEAISGDEKSTGQKLLRSLYLDVSKSQ